MSENDLLEVLNNEEIIAKVTKFLQEGCGCSHGTKGSSRIVKLLAKKGNEVHDASSKIIF